MGGGGVGGGGRGKGRVMVVVVRIYYNSKSYYTNLIMPYHMLHPFVSARFHGSTPFGHNQTGGKCLFHNSCRRQLQLSYRPLMWTEGCLFLGLFQIPACG